MTKVSLKYNNIEDVKVGDVVDYGFYSNVKVIGFDEKHVIMQDSHGTEKKVFKSLFVNHATDSIPFGALGSK